jgi:hypothetical protein
MRHFLRLLLQSLPVTALPGRMLGASFVTGLITRRRPVLSPLTCERGASNTINIGRDRNGDKSSLVNGIERSCTGVLNRSHALPYGEEHGAQQACEKASHGPQAIPNADVSYPVSCRKDRRQNVPPYSLREHTLWHFFATDQRFN